MKAAGIVLSALSLVAGCGVEAPTPPESSSPPEQCFRVSEHQIHALVWAVDSSSLFVMHGPGWTLDEIDASSNEVTRSVGDTLGTGPLASDGDGEPLWIANAEDLASVDLFRLNRISGSTDQWVLPHPRFHRLFWTAERILATEQSSVGEFGLQPEAMRLVELELAPGSVALVPAGPFEPSLTDVGVSVDGSTIVYVRGSGANSTISAEGALGGRRNVSGARFPDVWLNGGLVGFLGDDGFYSVWEPGSGSVETVSQTWAYASSLSATGRLALAEMTTEIGPTGRVCVTDLSSR